MIQFLQLYLFNQLKQKQKKDPRVQALFKHTRHSNISISKFSQDYHEQRKKIFRTSGKTYHILKANSFGGVRNPYQDETTMNKKRKGYYHFFSSTCWKEEYQSEYIDMTKDSYTGWSCLGLSSMFVPDKHRLLSTWMSI